MDAKITYFDKPGVDNTAEVLSIAKKRAKELGIKTIVVDTTTGYTGVLAAKTFKGMKVIAVTHSTGFGKPDFQELTEENRKEITDNGGIILTTTHLFRGVSGAMVKKFNTQSLGVVIANVLRLMGQGMKVVVEISVMAADAGLVRSDEDIIAIAGTGRGADFAVVLKPVHSNDFFDLKVKEILCKPHF
jgi:hypothetical protein